MTKWAQSLIRLSTYEVETLQKRLAEVVTRRTHAEMKIATLAAEYELECVRSAADPALGHSLTAYKRGYKMRRDTIQTELDLVSHEEEGVRDQLAHAFEDLKKFEHVAELSHLRRLAAEKKAENAALDEVALRMARPA
ncbi:flagellar FliJ family protein [Asticcacaulis sp. EMRT-3]|uniref:flagellar FliJ family protein n=1 Tax=Asticcacaulis sp. EMRT-3 TaxID=3040349 RepID=UPI0024AFAEF1|nr:flagellar FliJ family protein [Asticcacaulis sp. EMRT-3]MDI7776117.1 flagellar FliJ family protein [Asticcacaulis sp. EMRT-3]